MDSQQPDALTTSLADGLRAAVNRDGGWGYVPGKSSRLEPTCWALLALLDSSADAVAGPVLRAAVGRLAEWQGRDGLVLDTPSATPNLAFNGLCAVVLSRVCATAAASREEAGRVAEKLVAGITASRGIRLRNQDVQRQDNRLAGWPWIDGNFSWAEPTAWCLLALKKHRTARGRPDVAARIVEAERLLADRCCLEGGWNYGNSNVLGKELHPYVPTTALALLALQDRNALPEVARSLKWLAANGTRERSSQALSLALIALAVFGLPVEHVERALRARFAEDHGVPNLVGRAMALYALTGSVHGYAAVEI